MEALSSIRKKLQQLSPQTVPSIFKVPRQLRKVNDKAYEPEMVAIGPYHHGKDHLKSMEELKLRYFQLLLQRKPEVEDTRYTSAMEGMEQKARDCYAEPISLGSAEFIEMLVLDGCFIIEVVRRYKYDGLTPLPRSVVRGVQEDLILLENQIPFFVLCELFDLIRGPKQHDKLMGQLLIFYLWALPEGDLLYSATTMRNSEEVKHILDLIHTNMYSSSDDDTSVHFYLSTESFIIPSAAELKNANVKFQKKECRWSLFDVDFKEGILTMPILRIDDSTEKLLRNLIAHEQYIGVAKPTRVAHYAVLLDCLINSSRDVEILCRCGIIENMMGSNEEVADIVNRLTKSVHLYSYNMYADMHNNINTHYKKRWNRAVAVFHRDYFNSPWAYVSFFAALLLLLLTAAQTIFSAIQLINR